MAENLDTNQVDRTTEREFLTEPVHQPKSDGKRIIAHDGLDNSDLRMLLAVASEEPSQEK